MSKEKIILAFLFIMTVFLNVPAVSAGEEQSHTETKIEIKVSGEINEAQKAKINDLLVDFSGQEPQLKIDSKIKGEKPQKENKENKESGANPDGSSKAQKYYFNPMAVLALVVISIFLMIARFKKDAQPKINLLNNTLLGIVFVFSALSGILLIYGYEIQGFNLKFWHVIISSILLFLIFFHCLLHKNTWIYYLKRVLGIKRFLT